MVAATAAATTAAVTTTVMARGNRDRKMEFEMLYQVDYGHAALRTDKSSSSTSSTSSSTSTSSGRKGARRRLGLEVVKRVHLLIHVVSGRILFLSEGRGEKEREGWGGMKTGLSFLLCYLSRSREQPLRALLCQVVIMLRSVGWLLLSCL